MQQRTDGDPTPHELIGCIVPGDPEAGGQLVAELGTGEVARRLRVVEAHPLQGRDDREVDAAGADLRVRDGSFDGRPDGVAGREGDPGAGGAEGAAQRLGGAAEDGA